MLPPPLPLSRKSMLKFTDPHPAQAVLGLNGWSVPYKFGYLNLQVG